MARPARWRAPSQSCRETAGLLDLLDVDGLGALVAHLLFVGDLRSFGEGAIPVADDARVVDEEVSAALIGRDEAEALVVAEPLHGSGGHMQPVLHGILRAPPLEEGKTIRPCNGHFSSAGYDPT